MFPYAPWLSWIVPLIGAVLTVLLGTFRPKLTNYIAVVSIGMSTFFSVSMIPYVFFGNTIDLRVPWLLWELGVLVDPLSVVMACVVSGIGILVTLFSVGYMQDDPSIARFWFLIQLFIGGYVLIVIADNLLLMFIGWEIVGVCCTGLAAFWYKNPKKAHAGLKTFMILRVADLLFLMSILFIYTSSGTLNINDLSQNTSWMAELSKSGLLLITALMFFGGAVGKAAQFPLQVWLPDALAASPASFNALTECLAGPFIIARFLPIFHKALWDQNLRLVEMTQFFLVVAWMGAIAALVSAILAMAQTNIFRVLSYSISSIIGYMMTAFGLAGLMNDLQSGFLAGTFLLMVDAFITGLLFLTGAFISYAVGSDDIPKMSGFKSKIAHRSMEVGVLAIISMPPLSGFWCSNWIQTLSLGLSHEAGVNGQSMLMLSGFAIFSILIITGVATAFYGVRMMGYVFGKTSFKSCKTVRKPPRMMHLSLLIMLLVTIFFDFSVPFFIPIFDKFFLPMLGKSIFNNVFDVLVYIIPSISTVLTIAALAVGGYIAYKLYMVQGINSTKLTEEHKFLKKVHGFVFNRFYISELYYRIASLTISFSRNVYKYVETEGMTKPQIMGFRNLFDTTYRVMVLFSRWAYPRLELGGLEAFNRLVVKAFVGFSSRFRKIQSGVLSYNMLAMFVGIILLATLLLLFGGGLWRLLP